MSDPMIKADTAHCRQGRSPLAGEKVSPVEEVFAEVRSVVRRHAADEGQRRLLETALMGLEPHAGRSEPVFFVELPLLVYGAIRGDTRPAVPLAAAATLLFLGADIFDDLADGDRPAHWDGRSHAEITLAAANVLCALTPLALDALPAASARKVAMQATLSTGLLRMSAGQHSDVTARQRHQPSAADIEAAIAGKSGEELAIFAALAAQFAAASDEQVDHYAAMGRALGTGAQLASDCYELFTDPESRDLAHGTPTLPVALHRERLGGAEREAFEALLGRARTDEAARGEIRRQLIASGVLRMCAFVVETYRQGALRSLALADPREPGAGALRELIGRISFFPPKLSSADPASGGWHQPQTREEQIIP